MDRRRDKMPARSGGSYRDDRDYQDDSGRGRGFHEYRKGGRGGRSRGRGRGGRGRGGRGYHRREDTSPPPPEPAPPPLSPDRSGYESGEIDNLSPVPPKKEENLGRGASGRFSHREFDRDDSRFAGGRGRGGRSYSGRSREISGGRGRGSHPDGGGHYSERDGRGGRPSYRGRGPDNSRESFHSEKRPDISMPHEGDSRRSGGRQDYLHNDRAFPSREQKAPIPSRRYSDDPSRYDDRPPKRDLEATGFPPLEQDLKRNRSESYQDRKGSTHESSFDRLPEREDRRPYPDSAPSGRRVAPDDMPRSTPYQNDRSLPSREDRALTSKRDDRDPTLQDRRSSPPSRRDDREFFAGRDDARSHRSRDQNGPYQDERGERMREERGNSVLADDRSHASLRENISHEERGNFPPRSIAEHSRDDRNYPPGREERGGTPMRSERRQMSTRAERDNSPPRREERGNLPRRDDRDAGYPDRAHSFTGRDNRSNLHRDDRVRNSDSHLRNDRTPGREGNYQAPSAAERGPVSSRDERAVYRDERGPPPRSLDEADREHSRHDRDRGPMLPRDNRDRGPIPLRDDRDRGPMPPRDDRDRTPMPLRDDRDRGPMITRHDRDRGPMPPRNDRDIQHARDDRNRPPIHNRDDRDRLPSQVRDDRDGMAMHGEQDRVLSHPDDGINRMQHIRNDRDRGPPAGANNDSLYPRGERDRGPIRDVRDRRMTTTRDDGLPSRDGRDPNAFLRDGRKRGLPDRNNRDHGSSLVHEEGDRSLPMLRNDRQRSGPPGARDELGRSSWQDGDMPTLPDRRLPPPNDRREETANALSQFQENDSARRHDPPLAQQNAQGESYPRDASRGNSADQYHTRPTHQRDSEREDPGSGTDIANQTVMRGTRDQYGQFHSGGNNFPRREDPNREGHMLANPHQPGPMLRPDQRRRDPGGPDARGGGAFYDRNNRGRGRGGRGQFWGGPGRGRGRGDFGRFPGSEGRGPTESWHSSPNPHERRGHAAVDNASKNTVIDLVQGPPSTATTSQKKTTEPNSKPRPVPTPPVGEASGVTKALVRLADLEAEMEFAYAKHMMLVQKQRELRWQSAALKDLPVGLEAFVEEYEKVSIS